MIFLPYPISLTG